MYHVQKTDQKQRRQRSSWNYVNVYQFVYCHATRIHETLSLIFDRRRRRDHLLLDVYWLQNPWLWEELLDVRNSATFQVILK